MEIIKYNYEAKLKEAFIEMNKAWIIRDYILEDEDIRVLSNIDNEIKNGSIIYFAIYDNKPISTLMLINLGNGVYELAKFATKEGYENIGAGSKVLNYAINEAKKFAKRIIIATNKKCLSAIHLYKKYGFMESKTINSFGFSSSRVDICFELDL